MKYFLAAAWIAFAVPAEAQSEYDLEIIGHEYHCQAQIGDPLQSEKPSLYGLSKLNEKGVRKEFSAQFSSGWSSVDQTYFLSKRPPEMSKSSSHVRWSLNWRKYDNSWSPNGFKMGFYDAALDLDFSSWRTLPKSVVMLLGEPDSLSMQFGTPFIAFSDRWPGRQTGAGFSFPLAKILNALPDQKDIGWAVYKGPITRQMPYTSLRGQGTLDLNIIRKASVEFEKFHAALASDEADFENKCKREPVYYDPNAQI
jgi:hypothetical protein